jgi:hypothetical protein
MASTHITAPMVAPSSFVPVGLAPSPLPAGAPVANLEVGYPAAVSGSLQSSFWQSTLSDDTPPAGPQTRVRALFNLDVKTEAPFPTNWFTVPDRSNLTNRRVHLPLPDCKVSVSDCEDQNVINELDGFNLQPRLSIPFDGSIDVHSVSSHDVFLINLGDTVDGREHGDHVVGINQIVWDTETNALHVQSDQLLDQHTRYALIATNGIQDVNGNPVDATEAFRNFRHDVRGEYRHELQDAMRASRRLGIRERDIVDASVFTTESATAIMEKIRDQIHAGTPEPADFNLGPNGERTVFSRDGVRGITFHEQTGDNPPGFIDVQLNENLSALDIIPGAVSETAFGKYLSPDYEVHPGEYIPPVGTRSGTPAVQGGNEIYFNLFLPSGRKPEGGWPVAIFGHGNTYNKNTSFFVAAALAEHGIATIAINAVGHGFGPLGTLTVNSAGGPVTFAAGGRGRDQDGDHMIDSNEGSSTPAPRSILFLSDGIRQTAADLMQLVRVIQVGMDVHGDGQRDLDPSRIYYAGHSLGANYGTVFLAVEPSVLAGVPNSPGEPFANRQLGGRGPLGLLLRSREPSLINFPGIRVFGGRTFNPPYFDEDMPLRNDTPLPVRLEDDTTRIIQSPVTNTVVGAMAIQEVLDNTMWASQPGSPVAYAPHLRKAPLAGVPAKSVIYQFGKGDQSVPNPNTTAILRAGELADRATFYRHDLAYAEDPTIPRDPHLYLISPTSANALVAAIARAYQEQIASFFESDGKRIIHPEPARFFEVPINGPLPEDLNYIP